MEKNARIFANWFYSALNDGAGANKQELAAWDQLKKLLLYDESSKNLILEIEEKIELEGFRYMED